MKLNLNRYFFESMYVCVCVKDIADLCTSGVCSVRVSECLDNREKLHKHVRLDLSYC